MTTEVFILGQIGKAVFQQQGRYYLLDPEANPEPLECRAGDISLLFDSGSEVSIIATDEIDVAAIRETLEFDTRAYRALSMTLGGLDNELTAETRMLSVEVAEELLVDNQVRKFVWQKLSARLLPVTADIQGAIKYARSASALNVSSIYGAVLKSQLAIEDLLEAWNEVSPNFFASLDEAAIGERVLIEAGVFAEVVAALTSRNRSRLNSVMAALDAQPLHYGVYHKPGRGRSEATDLLTTENLPIALATIGLDCAQAEIDGLLKLLTSRNVSTVGRLRSLSNRWRLEHIRRTFRAKEGRPPKNFEVLTTLAMLAGSSEEIEQAAWIEDQIGSMKTWEGLRK